jgi:hypothetical protein
MPVPNVSGSMLRVTKHPGAGGSTPVLQPVSSDVEERVGGTTTKLTSLPVEVDISMYQGDDLTFTVTVTNPDSSPADLTGATFLSQIRLTPQTPNPPLAIIATSVTTNVVSCHIASADSTKVTVAVWDLQMTSSAGMVTTLVGGSLTCAPQVSE